MALWAIRVGVGVALILAGRRLFWLFVGGTGFVAALTLAAETLRNLPPLEAVLIALGAGLVGVLLALLIQRVALALAGFLAGGYVLSSLVGIAGISLAQYGWLVLLIGGILGTLLVLSLFDWALIVLSSLTGAVLVTQTIGVNSLLAYLLVLAATLLGIFVQAGSLTAGAGREQGGGE
jgi:hypothetical protein